MRYMLFIHRLVLLPDAGALNPNEGALIPLCDPLNGWLYEYPWGLATAKTIHVKTTNNTFILKKLDSHLNNNRHTIRHKSFVWLMWKLSLIWWFGHDDQVFYTKHISLTRPPYFREKDDENNKKKQWTHSWTFFKWPVDIPATSTYCLWCPHGLSVWKLWASVKNLTQLRSANKFDVNKFLRWVYANGERGKNDSENYTRLTDDKKQEAQQKKTAIKL